MMLTNEEAALVEGLLARQKISDASQDEEYAWAFDALLESLSSQPESAWRVIREVVFRAESEEALAYIAVVGVEELLSLHGLAFVNVLTEEAAASEKFRRCLAHVRQREDIDSAAFDRLVRFAEGFNRRERGAG